jgi:hypothetical protein
MNRQFLRRAGVLTLLASFSITGSIAGAQNLQPIDPLQRPKTGAGSFSFGVTANYSPDFVATGAGASSVLAGGLGLGLTYNVTERLAVTASSGISAARVQTQEAEGQANRTTSGLNWQGLTVGAQYTFDGRFAPSLGLQVALPVTEQGWSVSGSASASVLRDPVILDGTLAATWNEGGPPSVQAGAGVGFVVNEAITLRADAINSLSLGALPVPSTTLGLGGAYKLDEQHSVSVRSTFNILGGRTSTGFSVSYLYRP